METILVQVNSKKAYKLLKNLEELQLIKLLRKSEKPSQKLSEKYAGKLPADVAEEIQSYVTESRNEWGKRNI